MQCRSFFAHEKDVDIVKQSSFDLHAAVIMPVYVDCVSDVL